MYCIMQHVTFYACMHTNRYTVCITMFKSKEQNRIRVIIKMYLDLFYYFGIFVAVVLSPEHISSTLTGIHAESGAQGERIYRVFQPYDHRPSHT